MERDTPISRHLKQIAALRTSNVSVSAGRQQARAQDLMRAKLAADQMRLKDTRSMARKIEIKREVLPDYAPYIAQALSSDEGGQDDVLVTVMVWMIDAGDWRGALDVAAYAIRHGLQMPATFERTLAATVAEGFADAQGVDADMLAEVIALVAPFDMVDQIKAKLNKAYGLAIEASNPVAALDALSVAFELNNRIGVKRDIARIEAALAARAPLSDSAGSESDE
ncbi:phage terminase small subunit [Caballeronia sp. LZ001]|uniref:phage terminase small subunit n=2 Tax=Caballeronia TaxID=1827195 RepID=UPI0028583D14|nr:phage terminase small subunit [Caballeronia sp. LZ001]MDR5800065.1 phage terminase small subunit [Caballeronia sp. LZ001]MDR5801910.1 phage terminase small subunit [Caballeronia sp. LZ001]MDR5805275.1 phage terminase small subunit [Caballeronia sp. LZ001]